MLNALAHRRRSIDIYTEFSSFRINPWNTKSDSIEFGVMMTARSIPQRRWITLDFEFKSAVSDLILARS